jgi:hypothetical protein
MLSKKRILIIVVFVLLLALIVIALQIYESASFQKVQGSISITVFKHVWEYTVLCFSTDVEVMNGNVNKVDSMLTRMDREAYVFGFENWEHLCKVAARSNPEVFKLLTDESCGWKPHIEYGRKVED